MYIEPRSEIFETSLATSGFKRNGCEYVLASFPHSSHKGRCGPHFYRLEALWLYQAASVLFSDRGEYDPEANALYIRFRDTKPTDNIDIEDGLTVDLDDQRRLVEPYGQARGSTSSSFDSASPRSGRPRARSTAKAVARVEGSGSKSLMSTIASRRKLLRPSRSKTY